MTRTRPLELGRRRRAIRPEHRERVGRIAALWGALTLGGTLLLSALVLWHLARRGRLLRDRLDPPRPVRLPEVEDFRRGQGEATG